MFKDIITVSLASIFSIITLLLLTKLMGKRQISQMSMFDYINGITIGSIAAEMATSPEKDWLKFIVAMAMYALAAVFISWSSCKSLFMRRFFIGRAEVLYDNGKIYEKNLAHAKLDINEFLALARNAGYFDLSEISYSVLESNGQISFKPTDDARPLNATDMKITPKKSIRYSANVIMDGEIMQRNLENIGKDIAWLKQKLEEAKVSDLGNVFLATCDDMGQFRIYEKCGEMKKDIWI